MPDPLVECIPNFSEARRSEVVAQITQSILTISGVSILDQHSDLDHNRTVITMVGSPKAIEDAAFQAISTAAQLIDLNHHSGEHPRIGATDVVPFVPLRDVSMGECVEIARRLGKRVGDQLNIPVYLYESAATKPERHNLENIRRGEYEGLKEEIANKPERAPDFGPLILGTAGATVIGARQPLIAYNVFLTTNDVTIAQNIAKAIRHSSGGMHFVKSLGLLVEGMAQVSMNLTNYKLSPVARVVELIRREAARYGVGIHHSELVGLIPQDALIDAAVWYTQLDAFHPDQILEKRLYEVAAQSPEKKENSYTFLDDLANGNPTPGGGCAAAFTGSEAASLVAMVARLTINKAKYAPVEKQMSELIEKAEGIRSELTVAVRNDALAYENLIKAMKGPKTTPEEALAREEAIEAATFQAARVPLQVAEKSALIMKMALDAAALGNINAISDAGSAFVLAHAAVKAAGFNVRINLKSVKNKAEASTLLAEISALEQQAQQSETLLQQTLLERGKITRV
jgi:glutamate formiminotransferase / formiminotetrahydrofolate cyclodeaminase